MKCLETPIPGLILFSPNVYKDERGYFFESFRDEILKENGVFLPFVQDNQSRSTKGVLRGLHYQVGAHAQSKLIRVLIGEIYDVVVDLRENSPTFGQSFGVILNDTNHYQLYIPKGFAHGFLTRSSSADILYKCDAYYHKNSEAGIKFNDPNLNINWDFPEEEMILSEKDQLLPLLGHHKSTEINF